MVATPSEIDRLSLVFFVLCVELSISALRVASFISLFELLHSSFKSTTFFENFLRLNCIVYVNSLNQNGINKMRNMLLIFSRFERTKNGREKVTKCPSPIITHAGRSPTNHQPAKHLINSIERSNDIVILATTMASMESLQFRKLCTHLDAP